MKHKINDRVKRIEKRPVTEATVSDTEDPIFYGLQYDEGGDGWWPEDAIEALVTEPEPQPPDPPAP